ncbi:MAG: hypothetical protein IIB76_06070 [Proteobacteria bacterium]|nr:hypothetical protein [Pseudomonadota bacterium]
MEILNGLDGKKSCANFTILTGECGEEERASFLTNFSDTWKDAKAKVEVS